MRESRDDGEQQVDSGLNVNNSPVHLIMVESSTIHLSLVSEQAKSWWLVDTDDSNDTDVSM